MSYSYSVSKSTDIGMVEETMSFKSQAQINPGAPVNRLFLLVEALKNEGCHVHLDSEDVILSFEVPDEKMWWVLTGCITIFFDKFADVATWSFQFYQPTYMSQAHSAA